jgi:hypothetical protein
MESFKIGQKVILIDNSGPYRDIPLGTIIYVESIVLAPLYNKYLIAGKESLYWVKFSYNNKNKTMWQWRFKPFYQPVNKNICIL